MMLDYTSTIFDARQDASNRERRAAYKRRWSYYHGDQAKPLKVSVGQADDNVIINLARYIVDKGVAFLFGKDVGFQLEEGATTPAEETLTEIWRRNRKGTFLLKLAQLGAIYGHVFVKILPDFYGRGIARLVPIEAEYVDVSWRGDDIESAYRYTISWTEEGRDGKAVNRRQVIEQDETTGRWSVINRVQRGGGQFIPDPDNPDIVPWPYKWPPVVDAQNIPCAGVYYGLSDIEDLDEQDAINYVTSAVHRILRYHAHPKTWGRGFSAAQVEQGADDLLIIQSQSGELRNLEMQSDLASSLNYLDMLRTEMLRTGRVPDLTTENLSLGATSGFALRLLHGDLLEKTAAKQRTYGDLLVEINRRLLELAGYGENNYTSIFWDDPLPMNEQEQMTRDGFELDRGVVSKETVQRRRGLDPETENARIAAEGTAEDLRTGNVGALLIRQFAQGQGV